MNCTVHLHVDLSEFRFGTIAEKEYGSYLSYVLDEFIPREPIGRGFNVLPEEIKEAIQHSLKEWSINGVSISAVHMPTKEIAGVQFAKVITKDESTTRKPADRTMFSKNVQYNFHLLAHLTSSYNIFEDPQVEKVLELYALSVNKKFTGKGIGYRMVQECENLGLARGCQIAHALVTNKISQHMFSKMGYTMEYTLNYEEFEINGKRVMDLSLMEGSTKAQVAIKHLGKR